MDFQTCKAICFPMCLISHGAAGNAQVFYESLIAFIFSCVEFLLEGQSLVELH